MSISWNTLSVDDWSRLTIDQWADLTVNPRFETDFLADLIARRSKGRIGTGTNPLRFQELVGAEEVPFSSYEPDPVTSRSEWYYNTRHNVLFKRIPTIRNGMPSAVWKTASRCT